MKTTAKIIQSTIDLNKKDNDIIDLKIAVLTLTAAYAEQGLKCWPEIHSLIKLLSFNKETL